MLRNLHTTSLSAPSDAAVPPLARHANRKGSVAQSLLRDIFRGDFREGDRLTEQTLAAKYTVSRTPVREALLELEGLGIVELRRNCGAVVARFGESKLREIYEIRRLLEVEATRKSAAGRVDPALLDQLIHDSEALLNQGLADEGWRLDDQIHATIAESCGNRRLAYEISRYANLVRAVRWTVGERLPLQAITIEQHLGILRAIRRSDSMGAAEAMREHLLQAEESAVSAIG